MRLYDEVNHWDFIEMLAALPDTPAVIRAYLMGTFGVLVAPSFDKKVLNAVRTEPRVTLLRFSKESN